MFVQRRTLVTRTIMSLIRIALANIPLASTPEESLLRAVAAIDDAAARDARIVCFPECYVPGYRMPGSARPAPDAAFLASAYETVSAAAAHARIAIVLGTERFVEGRPRLTAMVVDNAGRLIGWQDKVQLDPTEDAPYAPGTDRHVFHVGGVTIGVTICHEGWRYPETVRWAARRGAQIVFHPHYHEADATSFVPQQFCDPLNSFHEKALLCRAAENSVFVAAVNCASAGSPTTSAVIRPDGSVQVWQPYGVEGLLLTDVDLSLATRLLASRCRTCV
jgi:predicted amidohydrolase